MAKIASGTSVYVALRSGNILMSGSFVRVIGTYASRGKALDACVEDVINCIESYPDTALTVSTDKNHPGAHSFFTSNDEGYTILDQKKKNSLKACLRDEMGSYGNYCISSGGDKLNFTVEESTLSGLMPLAVLSVVTRTLNGDREPYYAGQPKAYWNREDLIKWTKDYLTRTRKLCRCDSPSDENIDNIISQLNSTGSVEVQIGNGKLALQTWSCQVS